MKYLLLLIMFVAPFLAFGADKEVLLLDKGLHDPLIFKSIFENFEKQGWTVKYRRYHPTLVKADVNEYKIIMIAGGNHPNPAATYLSLEEGDLLKSFVENGGMFIMMPQKGKTDMYVFNRLCDSLGVKLRVEDNGIHDAVGYKSTLIPSSYFLNLPMMHVMKGCPLGEGINKPIPAGRPNAIMIGQIRGIEVPAWTSNTSMRFKEFINSAERGDECAYFAEMRSYPVVATAKAGKGYIIITHRSAFNMNGYTGRWSDKPIYPPYKLAGNEKFESNFAKYVVMISEGKYVPTDKYNLRRLENIGALAKPEKEIPPVVLNETAHPQDYETLQPFKMVKQKLPAFAKNEKIKAVYIQRIPDYDLPASYFEKYKRAGINLIIAMGGDRRIVAQENQEILAKTQEWYEKYVAQCEKYNIKVVLGGFAPLREAWQVIKYPTNLVDGVGETYKMPAPFDMEAYNDCLVEPAKLFARIAAKYPNTVVGTLWDLELYAHNELLITESYPYDDLSYGIFLDKAGDTLKQTGLTKEAKTQTATTRFRWLEAHGLLRQYYQIMEQHAYNMARKTAEEVNAIHPGLTWCFYAAGIPQSWYYRGMFKGFAGEGGDVVIATYETRGNQQTSYWKEIGLNMVHLPGILFNIPEGKEWSSFLRMCLKEESGYWLFPGGCITLEEGWEFMRGDASIREPASVIIQHIREANDLK